MREAACDERRKIGDQRRGRPPAGIPHCHGPASAHNELGADWARTRLREIDPAAALEAIEAPLRKPSEVERDFERSRRLQMVRELAPERMPELLALQNPAFRAWETAKRSFRTDKASIVEVVGNSLQRGLPSSGPQLVPLSARQFDQALAEAESTHPDRSYDREGLALSLAPHVPEQNESRRRRYLRLLERLPEAKRIECAWVADLRSQRAAFARLATSSPEDFAGKRGEVDESMPPGFRLHAARRIVSLWDEPDASTRALLLVAFALHRWR